MQLAEVNPLKCSTKKNTWMLRKLSAGNALSGRSVKSKGVKKSSECGVDTREGGWKNNMISLTSMPENIFAIKCKRHETRYLAVRGDDPDNKEIVLFTAHDNLDAESTVGWVIDTAVVLDRDTAIDLSQALLFIAANLDSDSDPSSNGHRSYD
tara:strand:+ start:3089 stop:3547 length:459 start_codon:yes stop_codon:yes gene_type:complete